MANYSFFPNRNADTFQIAYYAEPARIQPGAFTVFCVLTASGRKPTRFPTGISYGPSEGDATGISSQRCPTKYARLMAIRTAVWFTVASFVRQGWLLDDAAITEAIRRFSTVDGVDRSLNWHLGLLLATVPDQPRSHAQQQADVATIYQLASTISSPFVQP